jgi:HEAT repeat protein
VPQLLAAVDDSDPKVRYYVVRALGKTNATQEGVVAALQRATRDSDPKVREAAQNALKRHKRKQ